MPERTFEPVRRLYIRNGHGEHGLLHTTDRQQAENHAAYCNDKYSNTPYTVVETIERPASEWERAQANQIPSEPTDAMVEAAHRTLSERIHTRLLDYAIVEYALAAALAALRTPATTEEG